MLQAPLRDANPVAFIRLGLRDAAHVLDEPDAWRLGTVSVEMISTRAEGEELVRDLGGGVVVAMARFRHRDDTRFYIEHLHEGAFWFMQDLLCGPELNALFDRALEGA